MSGLKKFFLKKIYGHGKTFSFIIIVFVILNLFCFFFLPGMLRNFTARKLSEKLAREVTIERLRFNPYTFSLQTDSLFIHERGSKEVFFHCGNISADINIASIFKRSPRINELKIKRPYINIVRETESAYNFSDLLVEKSTEGPPLHFLVGNITIENGRLAFLDMPKAKKHLVRNMNISLPFISNCPAYVNIYTAPAFSAEINGTLFALEGKTKPFSDSLETFFDINIDRLSLPQYAAYVPVPLNFRTASAYLTADIRISYIQQSKEKSSFNIEGSLSFDELSIEDMGKTPLLKVPKIDIEIDSIDLFSRNARISSITATSPDIALTKEKTGITLFSAFRSGAEKKERQNKEAGDPSFIFDIDNIIISDGAVRFNDKTVHAPLNTVFKPVELNLTGLSNRKEKLAQVRFSAVNEDEETLAVNGDFGLTPIISQGTVEIGRIILNKYAPYYNDYVLFRVAGGKAAIKGAYRYSARKPELSFSEISLSLKDLKVNGHKGTSFFDVPAFNIKNADVNVTDRSINAGEIHDSSISIKAVREKTGSLDFLPLFPARAKAKKPVEKTAQKKWVFTVGRVKLANSSIHLRDNVPAVPADITAERLSVKISGIAPGTNKKSPLDCNFLLNGKDAFSAKGHITLSPFSSELNLSADNLQIMPFNPYVAEQMNIAVTGGSITSAGTLTIAAQKNKKTALSYKGSASIDNFKSMDGDYGDSLIGWKKLSLIQMHVGVNPSITSVEEISLQDFNAHAVVHADRTINLLALMKGNRQDSPEKQELHSKKEETDSPRRTNIGKITVQNGSISFLDKSIEPYYLVKMEGFEGNITGISSIKEEPANVDLSAKINGDSIFSVNGNIQPIGREFFLDINANMSGLDLTSASPYSGKYIGYTTQKGKLVLDLDYLIDKRKLTSQNKVILDQFTLGSKVDSPDATKLPVKFAVALLKDSSGRIQINLPVSGSLDDPKFRIGPIIVQVLVNLIAKAAVSPFSLLGSIFGGGEELSYLEFDYGTSVITPEEQKKLDTIAKILNDRPALNIEISGNTDAEKDTESLRNILFMKKVKMQKIKETAGKGEQQAAPENIILTDEEYGRYLWLAYKNSDFKKPRNVLGFVKELPVPEMEKALLDNTEVTENDLRLLATARGESAKNYLLDSGISSGRVFLLEPGSIQPEKSDTPSKASRADFRLK